MVEVIHKERKSSILTPSSIPCLRKLPTINITQGCSLGCAYCYIKSYRDYPGPDRVVLFTNTAELVAAELKRKRKPPSRVYFSPSSDAFQYLPEVQEVSYKAMRTLLDAGVEVAFLTKGFVGQRFLELFERHASLVHAQVGITSLDRAIWRKLEPRTAPPEQRIQTLESLARIGCNVTARLDPLVPDLTDASPAVDELLIRIAGTGVGFVAASYMFLRPAFGKRVASALQVLDAGQRADAWSYQEFTDGCSGGESIGEDERKRLVSNV